MRGVLQLFGGMLMIEGFAFLIFSTQWNIPASLAALLGLFLLSISRRFRYLGDVGKEVDQMGLNARKALRNLAALFSGMIVFAGVWALIVLLATLGTYLVEPSLAGATLLIATIISLVMLIMPTAGVSEMITQWE